jgi:hypothetical protein
MRRRLLLCAIALVLGASSAAAHHAISAYYDNAKRTTIEGVVTQFQFVSPHPFVIVELVNPSTSLGARGPQWRLEMDNRSELVAIGIRAETLKAGDRITVSGSLARDNSPGLYVLNLTRPADGFTYEQVGGSPRLVSPGRARRSAGTP